MLRIKTSKSSITNQQTALASHRSSLLTILQSPLPLLAAWLLTMIGVPILRWTWGDALLPAAISITVLLLVAAVLVILRHSWSRRQLLYLIAIVLPMTWAIEWVGSRTGFPFGAYHYTDLLQPQLLHVPLLIPFAWLMMLPPAWAIGDLLAPKHRILRAIYSALAFTAWDLFLDPQMVDWGLWQWEVPGGYFGIPYANFAGWFVAAFLITLCVNPYRLPLFPLLGIYIATWILQTIGLAFFWKLPGPAIYGFLAMGLFIALALPKAQHQYYTMRKESNGASWWHLAPGSAGKT
jgi:lycopene beta-cyclase